MTREEFYDFAENSTIKEVLEKIHIVDDFYEYLSDIEVIMDSDVDDEIEAQIESYRFNYNSWQELRTSLNETAESTDGYFFKSVGGIGVECIDDEWFTDYYDVDALCEFLDGQNYFTDESTDIDEEITEATGNVFEEIKERRAIEQSPFSMF